MEPDRLESWYVAHGDAVDGCSIAGLVTEQAQGIAGHDVQHDEHNPQCAAPALWKCTIGSKRRVPSVLELLQGESGRDTGAQELGQEAQGSGEGAGSRGGTSEAGADELDTEGSEECGEAPQQAEFLVERRKQERNRNCVGGQLVPSPRGHQPGAPINGAPIEEASRAIAQSAQEGL